MLSFYYFSTSVIILSIPCVALMGTIIFRNLKYLCLSFSKTRSCSTITFFKGRLLIHNLLSYILFTVSNALVKMSTIYRSSCQVPFSLSFILKGNFISVLYHQKFCLNMTLPYRNVKRIHEEIKIPLSHDPSSHICCISGTKFQVTAERYY